MLSETQTKRVIRGLIDSAIADANTLVTIAGTTARKGDGYAVAGRYAVRVVPVGRPSVGQSSACTTRTDYYLDGKRVSRSALIAEKVEGDY